MYAENKNKKKIKKNTKWGLQHPPVVLAESVGLQDTVITSFSGAGGGGKKVSVVLAESVGLQDSVATPTIGVQHPPVELSESGGLQDDVITSFSVGGGGGYKVSIELCYWA